MGDEMTMRVALWNEINTYAESCGGNPAAHVYGNTRRMNAVAEIERVVREHTAAAVERERERCVRVAESLKAEARVAEQANARSGNERARLYAQAAADRSALIASRIAEGYDPGDRSRPPLAGVGKGETALSQWTEGTIAGSAATAEGIVATLRADAERFRDRAAECDGQEAYDLCVRAGALDAAADDIAKGPRRYYQGSE